MISVVVTVYNIKEEYLRHCIESLINQTNKNFEIIIIEDGSTDNSGEIVDSYKDISNIKIIHKEDEGVSIARNLGMEVASGDWINFVDGDDYCSSTMIETMYKTISKNTDVIIYASYVNYSDKEVINSFLPYEKNNNVNKEELLLQIISKNYSKFYPIDTSVSVPWAKLYRKSFLNSHNISFVKGMNRMQDVIFNLYAIEEAKKIKYVDIPIYHYLKNANSIVHKFSDKTIGYYEKMLEETEKFLNTYKKEQLYYDALNLKRVLAIERYLSTYYFHKDNTKSYKEIKKEIITQITTDKYIIAIKNVKSSNLNLYQKVFVFLLKRKQVLLLKLLCKIKQIIKNRKINS